ncbi:MAG: DUF1365 domain-containing protein [Alphaproteobacteria bacterium]|nr:DUF1365 domain-containing protein [Alphaproteobacteria bacterium]
MPSSAIYRTEVIHARTGDVRHRLRHSVFYLYLDLGKLDEAAVKTRLFSVNRFNLLSFFDRDHGARDGTPVKAWVEDQLKRAGLFDPEGRICLLTLPRLLGYVFNPLSVYYCFDRNGALIAVLHEVRNTFGELHGYLLPAHVGDDGIVRQSTDKRFHVSPFIDMAALYQFRLMVPDERLDFRVCERSAAGAGLKALMRGTRRPLTDRELLAAVLSMPLMTVKVIAAIHWHALRLWLKGAPLHAKPRRPADDVTLEAGPQEGRQTAAGNPTG